MTLLTLPPEGNCGGLAPLCLHSKKKKSYTLNIQTKKHRDAVKWSHTQEVIRGERLKVPDLQDEDGRKLLLSFIQGENTLSLLHDHHL